ncbi:hypothetical protein HK101_004553 [Irineochytrium annulatum]|nr:hypothetical protein HK101_004553 [Irineochytrium annulatum]
MAHHRTSLKRLLALAALVLISFVAVAEATSWPAAARHAASRRVSNRITLFSDAKARIAAGEAPAGRSRKIFVNEKDASTPTATADAGGNDPIPTPTGDVNITGTLVNQANFAKVNAFTGIGAAIMIVTGIILVFWGHYVFKPVLFIAGFYLFALLTFVIMQAIEAKTGNHYGGGDHRDLVYLISCVVLGILGGALLLYFWKFGMFAVGALFGFALATFILTLIPANTVSPTARTVIVILCAIVFGVLIHFLEKPLLIFGTAIPGSLAIMVGIDVFANVGFRGAVRSLLVGESYSITWQVGCFLGAFALFSLVGVCFQFWHHRRRGRHDGLAERDRLMESDQMTQKGRF